MAFYLPTVITELLSQELRTVGQQGRGVRRWLETEDEALLSTACGILRAQPRHEAVQRVIIIRRLTNVKSCTL